MSAPGLTERTVRVQGEDVRVWEKGQGEPLGYFAGLGGLLEWTPFLDELAKRRRVIVPSLPGFPGGGQLHRKLDGLADWVICTLDILEAAGLAHPAVTVRRAERLERNAETGKLRRFVPLAH